MTTSLPPDWVRRRHPSGVQQTNASARDSRPPSFQHTSGETAALSGAAVSCVAVATRVEPPLDWPDAGPIDLHVHDAPHASASLEWWYVNSHVRGISGREFAVFAAFFRQACGVDPATHQARYAHSVSWAVCDLSRQRYYPKVAVDAAAPALGLAKLDAGAGQTDERSSRALREILERGHVPGPTQMFASAARVAARDLELSYGDDHLFKTEAGAYRVELFDEASQIECELTFRPQKPPIRHGDDGVLHGVADEQMFYYFIPRCEVSGALTLHGETEVVSDGSGWYDHEFGFIPASRHERGPSARDETSWRWVSVQLDNGVDVSVFVISGRGSGEVLDNWTIVSSPAGERRVFTDAVLTVVQTWQSQRSYIEYPTRLRLELRQAGLELEIEAAFPDQEILTVISDPGFWEGRVNVRGSLEGRQVTGRGWVECKGFRFANISEFFDAVGKRVSRRLADLLPLQPAPQALAELVVRSEGAVPEAARYVEGVPAEQLARAIIQPIREISDRGGKGWRSYAALACIDVVGGDSRRFGHWLPMPELLHVGSLIIDDVEDASTVRRGAATCHLLHGQNRAINAGTAAYFLAEPPVWRDDLPSAAKLRIYRLYFDAMRAGHAGQALDLEGVYVPAERAVASGDTAQLEQQVLAIHRLKTAVPAGMMARVGAILGGGTEPQIEALGRFFEAVGIAFQITDDVLNLRGFERGLKERGEDIRHGKVTLPIVKALARLPFERRTWLWHVLRSNPLDAAVVDEAIELIEQVGALDSCSRLARDHVDDAWSRLDPLLDDSQIKLTFRAFSWFVLDRHY
jgi:geranylgeranyl pyrophosphate synthase/predicted secreted hydrolase